MLVRTLRALPTEEMRMRGDAYGEKGEVFGGVCERAGPTDLYIPYQTIHSLWAMGSGRP
jgi:hypothetical protein